jgi:hypothetical protein
VSAAGSYAYVKDRIAERFKREFQADLIADKMLEIADATDVVKAQKRIDRLKAELAWLQFHQSSAEIVGR